MRSFASKNLILDVFTSFWVSYLPYILPVASKNHSQHKIEVEEIVTMIQSWTRTWLTSGGTVEEDRTNHAICLLGFALCVAAAFTVSSHPLSATVILDRRVYDTSNPTWVAHGRAEKVGAQPDSRFGWNH